MPRLVMVCGSLGARSSNQAMLDVAAACVRDAGWQVEGFARLREIPPFDPELQDHLPPAVAEMTAMLARADLIAIAAPEYGGGVAGQTKNALDWQIGAAGVYRKPIVVMSSGTTGGEHAQRTLTQTLLWQGGWVVGHCGLSAPRTKTDAQGVIVDPATLSMIRSTVDQAMAAHANADRCVELSLAVADEFGVDPHRVAPA